MASQVIMPQLGESVVEGTVSAWLKKVGDAVTELEPLLEVSTDKVTTEVPAPASGILLEIFVQEDQTVAAGTVLCLIGEAGEKAAPSKQNGHTTPPPPVTISRTQGVAPRLTPVVARMVAQHQIDLSQVRGTGGGGRITKKDVEAYLGGAKPAVATDLPPWEQPGSGDLFKPTDSPAPVVPAPRAAPPLASAVPAAPPRLIPPEPIPAGGAGELMKLSPMRRSIAEHMVQSKLHTSPHVSTVFEVDLSGVLVHLAAHKPEMAKQGVNLTLTAYFVQAMAAACRAVPLLNSQWTDEGIYIHHQVHVGMAVAVEEGLLVPVIRNAEDLNLLGTARRVNDLAQRARAKQLKPDELKGSTITITNHGVSGSLFATPIINQPNTAIFGVGMMEKRVKVVNDAIAIRPCAYISLTFDHRVADGAAADGWMLSLKQYLEGLA
jgi:2-oxoglutarate dehydrogenase E2 component (dihydrolipoamide succinyltransferase)